METVKDKIITVEATVNVPVAQIWEYWNEPDHITQWYFASDDWHAPHAENDLWVNGKFKIRMSARDESSGFDFEGVYAKINKNERIEFIIPDGRKVIVTFADLGGKTRVTEAFQAETVNPYELQKGGWQAILNNFKKYAESR